MPGGAGRHRRARRTATATLIEEVAEEAGHDPDTLEAMVYLESAGFPDARAGGTADAVGLTQILAETGQNLLGMRVDVARSARLTRQIAPRRAARPGRARRAPAGAAPRASTSATTRAKAIEAAARYLTIAEGELGGSEELAVVSLPHGHRQPAERAASASAPTTTRRTPSCTSTRARCATPPRTGCSPRSATTRRRTCLRVEAARDVMRRWREDPERARRPRRADRGEELARGAAAPDRDDGASSPTPEELEEAYDDGDVVPLPARGLRGAGVRVDRGMGELAGGWTGRGRSTAGCAPRRSRCSSTSARGTEAISDAAAAAG